MTRLITTQPIINDIPFRLYKPNIQRTGRDISVNDYWKYQWACGHTLATTIIGINGVGKRYLELGPGLGLCSIVAAYRGFEVTIVDKELEALKLASYNIQSNHLPKPICVHSSWYDFKSTNTDKYDIIAAGDCCYNKSSTQDVLDILYTKLVDHGTGYATDQLSENYIIDLLPSMGMLYTQTFHTSPVSIELPNRYDKPNNCLFTIKLS